MQKEISLKSTIICPSCRFSKEETMPENACQFFYECENYKTILKPQKVTIVFSIRMAVFLALQFNQIEVAATKIVS